VTKLGFFADCGPLKVFVSKKMMPPGWSLLSSLLLFLFSTSLVPFLSRSSQESPLFLFFPARKGMALDTAGAPRFVSDDGEVELAVDSEVRLSIVGMKMEADGLSAIGSIKEDYLGVISGE
jgi:DNA-directed RNA polymerase subunit E'/Rpb7